MKLIISYNKKEDKVEIQVQEIEAIQVPKLQMMVLYRNGQVVEKLPFDSYEEVKLDQYRSGRFQVVLNYEGEIIRSNSVFKGEETVKVNNQEITYYFSKGTKKGLVIVFTAMVEDYRYTYNYVDTLDNVEVDKLYLLDNKGKRGCYYLGEGGDWSFEQAILLFLEQLIEKNGLSKNQVVTVGSSKGGYCAIYYGLKLNLGYVVAAAPQFLLGDFLYTHYGRKNVEVAEYITGSKDREENIEVLNNLMKKLIANQDLTTLDTHIYIVIGTEDDHYEPQFLPLLQYLVKYNMRYTVIRSSNMNHRNMTSFFCPHLQYLLDITPRFDWYLQTRIQCIQDIEERSDKDIPSNLNEYGKRLIEEFNYNQIELITSLIYYSSENKALKDLVRKVCKENHEKLYKENLIMKEELENKGKELERFKLYIKKYYVE